MTQEEKELLLKDLACRLTYSVKAHYKYYDFFGGEEQLADEGDGIITAIDTNMGNPIKVNGYYTEAENVKPYLRSISSMNEEEQIELGKLIGSTAYTMLKGDFSSLKNLIEYVCKNHIDLFGLIQKDLALEAPKDMHKI